jgi:hypothetical protein
VVLVEETAVPVAKVPDYQRCGRSDCRALWPKAPA